MYAFQFLIKKASDFLDGLKFLSVGIRHSKEKFIKIFKNL